MNNLSVSHNWADDPSDLSFPLDNGGTSSVDALARSNIPEGNVQKHALLLLRPYGSKQWFPLVTTEGLSTEWDNATSGNVVLGHHLFADAHALDVRENRIDRLIEIQTAFGLSTQALATILNISRATLYKWMDPRQRITLRRENLNRLKTMQSLAQRWRSLTSSPLSLVSHEPLPSGETIVDALTVDILDEDTLEGKFRYLIDMLSSRRQSRTQRLRALGFRRRPSHRSLPSEE